MKYIVTINNKSYEVEVEKGEASVVSTTELVAGKVPLTTPAASAAAPAPAAAPAGSAAASVPAPAVLTAPRGEKVAAPMPGTVVSIKVSDGDRVRKGDVLLVLEAMKMENEIVAPIDGVVVQIIATKGSSVSTGDALVFIQ